jgi:O-antigen ligase
MKQLQKYLLYLYIFSINFEMLDPLNTGINFLITKVTVVLYLLSTLLNVESFYSSKNIKKYVYPILAFFILLTVMSFKNQTLGYTTFFNVPVFLDILILFTVLNHAKKEPQLLLKCLFVFTLGSIILTILYYWGINTEEIIGVKNRATIFQNNNNELGLKLCISLLIMIAVIHENRLKMGKKRFLFYAAFPFLFIFLVGTASRVAFISLFLGVITFYFLQKQIANTKKVFFILLLIIILIPVWYFYLNSSLLTERLGDSIIKGDLSSRDLVWLTSLKLIPENLLFGQGETGYLRSITLLLGYSSSPHSVILEILCYTGIVGLILFLIFFIRIIKCIKRSFIKNKELLPLILIFPVLGMMLSGQILGAKIVWVLFAYMISPYVSRDFQFSKKANNQKNIINYKHDENILYNVKI